jgi:hypothetical protein
MMMKMMHTGNVFVMLLISAFTLSAQAATKQHMQCGEEGLKNMDTNKDSMISKEEYLAYHEQAFDKMKLTDGMISLKAKKMESDHDSSMNHKSMGTTSGKDNVNKRDAVNGESY